MATFQSRTLFFSTSPRNPQLVSEYLRLIRNKGLENQIYDKNLQVLFYEALKEEYGKRLGNSADPEFSGREKLTRMPQALGFLLPHINKPLQITDAGELLMDDKLFEDVLLHQILKFQLPSALHSESKNNNEGYFRIKPFLEIIRLVDYLGYLTYQELEIFAMSMTDYRKFDDTVKKIKYFREERENVKGRVNLKEFYQEYKLKEFRRIYEDKIKEREFKVRESKKNDEKHFLKTKISTNADYTDAIFRTLRATGIITLSRGKSISISNERKNEVDFILKNVGREIVDPFMASDEYFKYLTNPKLPVLLTDNLVELKRELDTYEVVEKSKDIYTLKSILAKNRLKKRESTIENIKNQLKLRTKADIEDVIDTFKKIQQKDADIVDRPSMLEWNMWRAAVMINHGDVNGNFIPDDEGYPITTAGGGKGDVVGDYGEFNIIYEVTLSRGKTQHNMEGEPVPRHVGEMKKSSGKDTFAFFIAEKVNPESIYHFYLTTATKSKIYGGNVNIIPVSLDTFITFFEKSMKKNIQPKDLYQLHQHSIRLSREGIIEGHDENFWHSGVTKYLLDMVN